MVNLSLSLSFSLCFSLSLLVSFSLLLSLSLPLTFCFTRCVADFGSCTAADPDDLQEADPQGGGEGAGPQAEGADPQAGGEGADPTGGASRQEGADPIQSKELKSAGKYIDSGWQSL